MRKLFSRLAKRAEESSARSLLVTCLCSVVLLVIPVFFSLLLTHPFDLFGRFYGFSQEGLMITDAEVVYNDENTVLAAPRDYFPAEDIERNNTAEIFDRLALLNNYYRDFFLPVVALLSGMSLFGILTLTGLLAGLLGLGRKFTHRLTLRKKFRVFAASSWLPALLVLIPGFFFPIFHMILFQLLMTALAWQVQKNL
ncbi:MAG: hypothetical protein LBR72_06285 [Oscillospiraceae bacterium]|jgi:hypothetical protein|nr:hypothetical protein [Oscillospiraceae bacterium]